MTRENSRSPIDSSPKDTMLPHCAFTFVVSQHLSMEDVTP
jgi:hypothetical protein